MYTVLTLDAMLQEIIIRRKQNTVLTERLESREEASRYFQSPSSHQHFRSSLSPAQPKMFPSKKSPRYKGFCLLYLKKEIHHNKMYKVLTAGKANCNEWFRAIKSTFCENVLGVKWENEDNFYIIINLSKEFIDLIKGMFYKPSSDLFLKHRRNSNVFLILERNTFVCHRCKLEKMIGLLNINIRENSYLTAYMRFDEDISSFIPEKKNKNDKEQSICFSSKLDYQMLRRIPSSDAKRSSVSDNINIKSDSSKRLIVCKCECSKPCTKRKIRPPFKSEHSPNRICENNVCLAETLQNSYLELSESICRNMKSSRNVKSCQSRKPEDSSNNNNNNIVCLNETEFDQMVQVYQVVTFYPLVRDNGDLPLVPDGITADGDARRSSQGSLSTDVLEMPLQENIASLDRRPGLRLDQNNVRSHTLEDDSHLYDMPNFYSENNHTPMECDEYEHTTISDESVSHRDTSRSANQTGQFQFREISFDNVAASANGNILPRPALGLQNGSFPLGPLGSSSFAQDQKYPQQISDKTLTEPAPLQALPRQKNRNDDLLHVLGYVRCPDYADLTDRLDTFLRWPSDIAQTPHQVAEAGFYYTGFQDIVRCFVCDGGLKNWDPHDDPWIEHARWFPQCAYVRHIKGEEFISLVRMMTEDENDPTVHEGATWQRTETSNINADSAALNETTEPSVLEHEDAQIVIEMGYSQKDVAMAINDIFKKGRQDYTSQEIADIILEKQMRGALIDFKLATDSPSSVGNTSTVGHVISENKQLKELLQCTECKSKQRNILFLPCTHHVVCESCSRDLHICTCCYRKIKEKVRTYMS